MLARYYTNSYWVSKILSNLYSIKISSTEISAPSNQRPLRISAQVIWVGGQISARALNRGIAVSVSSAYSETFPGSISVVLSITILPCVKCDSLEDHIQLASDGTLLRARIFHHMDREPII